jgi:hypothetical protein
MPICGVPLLTLSQSPSMGGSEQISYNGEFFLITRSIDHDDICRQAVFTRKRVKLRPAIGDCLIHKIRRNRHVQTAVMRGMKVGKFALYHERAVTCVRTTRQVESSGPRNRHKTLAHFHSSQRLAKLEQLFLKPYRCILVKLRMRIGAGGSRTWSMAVSGEKTLHACLQLAA